MSNTVEDRLRDLEVMLGTRWYASFDDPDMNAALQRIKVRAADHLVQSVGHSANAVDGSSLWDEPIADPNPICYAHFYENGRDRQTCGLPLGHEGLHEPEGTR